VQGYLGIELGSTRIKAVLIDKSFSSIASGGFEWENKLEGRYWTYSLEDVWEGLRACYRDLAEDYEKKYGEKLTQPDAIGISAMMHGYLPFDKDGNQLAAFRTWRNTTTEKAAVKLSELFSFNIPLRWSVAHIYQAILDGERHVREIDFLTTLSGYVHLKLTGEKVIGIGDASGMFPIDSEINDYNTRMIEQFDELVSDSGMDHPLRQILPKVLNAGDSAGFLSEEGALLLDPSGNLKSGIPLCPPEGDAGTGMVATNSVAELTGNISSGTSIFAMIVLEKELSKTYPEIDMVTTPAGKPVAMVHCNNFTSDIDAWVKLLRETVITFGTEPDKDLFYETLYKKAMEADVSCGGMAAYNYFAGEPITGTDEGRPLFVRMPDSSFTLANFFRTLVFSAMGTLKLGMDMLTENEKVNIKSLIGHGGFFRTKIIPQKLMAAALNVPVTVMGSEGEGGAWGIALLAAYLTDNSAGQKLGEFLSQRVFGENAGFTVEPDPADVGGFTEFMKMYVAGLEAEKAAIKGLKNL
jgi:sugar (pentulose or hexulose) kinase